MAFLARLPLRLFGIAAGLLLMLAACGGGDSRPATVYSSALRCSNAAVLTSTVSQAAADALVPSACPPITDSQFAALGFSFNTIGAGPAASTNVSLHNLPPGATLTASALALQDASRNSYALAITVNPVKLTATPPLPFATTLTVASGSLNFTNLPSVSMISKTIVTGPAPQAPLSSFSFGAGPYYIGEAVNFNGAPSTDADGSIASYVWRFGDGGAGTGKTVSHSYLTSGTYVVSLTVTDDTGISNVNTASINVVARPPAPPAVSSVAPIAVIGPAAGPVPFDGIYRVGVLAAFGGHGSTDADGTIVSYAWDFGDGSGTSANSIFAGYHTYTAAGSYQLTLTVTDNSGLSGSATITVSVVP